MKRILILEDDDSIAELERDYLEIAGFEAVIIANGREGLQRGLEGRFDLVLLDVMLPEMDGFEICRALRRETQIPILMVTARKEDIDKIRGLGLGADDYVVKPFSPRAGRAGQRSPCPLRAPHLPRRAASRAGRHLLQRAENPTRCPAGLCPGTGNPPHQPGV